MARLFDGANSRISAAVIDISAPPLTFGAWVFPKSAGEGSAAKIIRTEISGGQGSELVVAAGPVLSWGSNYDTVNASATASTILTTGQFWAVFGVLQSSDQKPHLFQGSLSAAMAEVAYTSGPTAGSVAATTGVNTVLIGNRTDQTATWDGIIAFAAIWRRVLTLSEMDLFRQGRMPSGAFYYWPLDQPDVTQSYEFISGKNGTDTSTTYAGDPLPMRFNRPLALNVPGVVLRPAPFKPGVPAQWWNSKALGKEGR